jgi:hypothetical protein
MKHSGVTSRGRTYVRTSIDERFASKVNEQGPVPQHCPDLGPCHIWQGSTSSAGYGCLRGDDGRTTRAHLVAWLLTGHEPPGPGLELCHHCDVRTCVNPRHLFLGTRSDNMQDASSKGRLVQQIRPEAFFKYGDNHWTRRMPERVARGERQGRASITADTVREIRALRGSGLGASEIAVRLGVRPKIVSDVIHSRTWRHVA